MSPLSIVHNPHKRCHFDNVSELVIYYGIVSANMVELFFMKKTIGFLRNFLGFSESGRSILGKHARSIFVTHRVRQGMSVAIVGLLNFTFVLHNFSNIGGPLNFIVNSHQAPKTLIDAQTKVSVQSPIEFEYESRGFSWFHSGVDLVAPIGTPVKPIMEGVVEEMSDDPFGYGNHIIVGHPEGLKSIYGHLSEIEIKIGQKVELNTEIGKSGSTGFSTGPHLHLEVSENGNVINPASIVPGVK